MSFPPGIALVAQFGVFRDVHAHAFKHFNDPLPPHFIFVFFCLNGWADFQHVRIASSSEGLCTRSKAVALQNSRPSQETGFSAKISLLRRRIGGAACSGVINPPRERVKYGYFTAENQPGDPDEWLSGAEYTEASWWDHWSNWLDARGGTDQVPAREPGGGNLSVLEAAPGNYVKAT